MKMKPSRRYQETKKKIFTNRTYSVDESLKFLKENNKESSNLIKASFSLNWVNQKNSLKEKIVLPNPINPKKKMIVVDKNIPEELNLEIKKKKFVEILDLDRLKEETSSKKIGSWRFEKILFFSKDKEKEEDKNLLKRLLPKSGNSLGKEKFLLTSNTQEFVDKINKFELGEREIKTDKGGNIHAVLGDTSFTIEQLKENYLKLVFEINRLRTPTWKGEFLKKVTLSTAMGPGLKTSIIK